MKYLLFVLSFLFVSSAFAGGNQAIFAESGPAWTTIMDADAKGCTSLQQFKSGKYLGFTVKKGELRIGVSNIPDAQAIPPAIQVTLNDGAGGVFTGTRTAEKTISFKVSAAEFYRFAKAKSINLDGIGNFDLTGSAKAIDNALSCFALFNSI